MPTSDELDRELGVVELRERFCEHTRTAYALLPPFDAGPPRILDIGCGTGVPSLELARLSGGEVVGIDIDGPVLDVMRERALRAGLGDRVTARRASIYDTGFEDGSFDLLWEEGVLHLLDVDRCLPECRRLLKPACHLVMHETCAWFDGVRDRLPGFGFELRRTHQLPEHCWLTAYADSLDANLRAFARSHRPETLDEATSTALAAHRAAVESIRADPGASDSAFYLVQSSH